MTLGLMVMLDVRRGRSVWAAVGDVGAVGMLCMLATSGVEVERLRRACWVGAFGAFSAPGGRLGNGCPWSCGFGEGWVWSDCTGDAGCPGSRFDMVRSFAPVFAARVYRSIIASSCISVSCLNASRTLGTFDLAISLPATPGR